MSLSALTVQYTGTRVARTVVRRILAFDPTVSAVTPIEPGAILEICGIVRHSGPPETPATDVYVMEFEFGGRTLRCPLVEFQARTQTSPLGGMQADTAA